MKRVLITGSREWRNGETIRTEFLRLEKQWPNELIVIVHGGARGADTIAKNIAETEYNFETEVHLADWGKNGKIAGHVRNQKMVDLGADICLAFSRNNSNGTRSCITKASHAGIPVKIFEEN